MKSRLKERDEFNRQLIQQIHHFQTFFSERKVTPAELREVKQEDVRNQTNKVLARMESGEVFWVDETLVIAREASK